MIKKIILPIFLVTFFTQINAQNKIEGMYLGLEKICWSKTKSGKCINKDVTKANAKWYHENVLLFRDDSVFLQQSPITILKGRKSYSASDGGFYSYVGKVTCLNNTFEIKLTELSCDYCVDLQEKQKDGSYKRVFREKMIKGVFVKQGLLIKGFTYRKSTNDIIFFNDNAARFIKND
jgi:hypothetical protein